MKAHDQERMKMLLQAALPPVEADLDRDLWPAMLRRLHANPAILSRDWLWIDGALLAGFAAFIAVIPAAIPVLLYCL